LAGQIEAGDGLIDERMTEDRKLQLIPGVRNRLLSSQVSEGPDSITTTAGGFDFKEETYDEEKLIKMENKCKAASQELRSTELAYVKNILVLIKKFYEPLAQLSRSRWRFALYENDLATLFNDITSIASLHQIIYDELKSSSESKVFTKHLDFFKLYTNYARSYEGILQILSKKKNDKKFRKILYGLQTSRVSLEGDFAIAPEDEPNFMNQTLESYLILPIQRIPRYILLFREIEKNMPRRTANLSELQLVDKIIRRLESVCHIINDFQTSHSNALDIVRIQDLIQDGHFYSLPDYLLQPHRKFLKEGIVFRVTGGLWCSKKEIKLYLFNDILLWTAKSNRFKGTMDLTNACLMSVSVSDFKSKSTDPIDSSLVLHIVPASEEIPLSLLFVDEDSKSAWQQAISDAIHALGKTVRALFMSELELELPNHSSLLSSKDAFSDSSP